jgi:hypothetical protein
MESCPTEHGGYGKLPYGARRLWKAALRSTAAMESRPTELVSLPDTFGKIARDRLARGRPAMKSPGYRASAR